MGTWGVGSFENDQALDLLCDLEDSDDLSLLEELLDVSTLEDGVDESVGPDIVGAAEIVAALLGRPSDTLPEEASAWVKAHKNLDASSLVESCRIGLDAVLGDDSGLKALWEETDDFDEWKSDVESLKKRISG